MSAGCVFIIAWVGECGAPPVDLFGRCDKHADATCEGCGQPATQQCPFAGQFVCGAPLCSACDHVGYGHRRTG